MGTKKQCAEAVQHQTWYGLLGDPNPCKLRPTTCKSISDISLACGQSLGDFSYRSFLNSHQGGISQDCRHECKKRMGRLDPALAGQALGFLAIDSLMHEDSESRWGGCSAEVSLDLHVPQDWERLTTRTPRRARLRASALGFTLGFFEEHGT